jgi:hypothetical protein
VGKDQRGEVPPWLQEFEQLAVYPFCAFDRIPCDGMYAYAEAAFRTPEGDFALLPDTSGWLRLWPDRMFFGGAVGWVFSYRLGVPSGTEPGQLVLVWERPSSAWLRLEFERVDRNPGPHLNSEWQLLLPAFPHWKEHLMRHERDTLIP